ncbi:hypothetical protein SEA_A3WALLY_330 [Microbacterium phage A3Wally]|nr:hypothetical protein SEA_A3WALLY_330 [Microbacterium phage A3Wally]
MAEVEKPVKVGGISAPYRVTTESTGHPDWMTTLRLYRKGVVEPLTEVEYRYLSEVDSAKLYLLQCVGYFERARIEALAVMEALREAGAAEEVVRQVRPAGFAS